MARAERAGVTRRTFLAATAAAALMPHVGRPGENTWRTAGPIMLAREDAFDATAVKDPTIVQHENRWHLFYTARGHGQYSIGYTAADSLEELGRGERYALGALVDSEHYAAAPQVFYFRPHETWYLVYQTRDANYLPVYATNPDISDPGGWTGYAPLMQKDDRKKWIDFWVLCDDERAYCYYTRDHEKVYARSTTLDNFPRGWGEATEVYGPVHEAVHVYRWADGGYFMVCEQRTAQELRYFTLAKSEKPLGPFELVDDRFATGEQLRQPGAEAPWTAEVSHGEVIRAGYDERMLVPAGPMRLLIQGLPEGAHVGPYPELPWRLGLIAQR